MGILARNLPTLPHLPQKDAWLTSSPVFHIDNLVLGPAAADFSEQALRTPAIQGPSQHQTPLAVMRNNDQLALHSKFDEGKGY